VLKEKRKQRPTSEVNDVVRVESWTNVILDNHVHREFCVDKSDVERTLGRSPRALVLSVPGGGQVGDGEGDGEVVVAMS
jgi:hypothetical protein